MTISPEIANFLWSLAGVTIIAVYLSGLPAPGASVNTWSHDVRNDTLELTYIANMGVLVSAGDSKVLIDALFEKPNPEYRAPAPEVLDKMMKGRAPFDGLDLLLVTHNHPDHFDAALAARYLAAFPEPVLVAPADAVAEMQKAADWARIAPRVVSLDIKPGEMEKRDLKGVSVIAFRTLHSGGGESPMNIMYLFNLGGWSIFHEGDSVGKPDAYQAFGLGSAPVDLALVHFWFPLNPDCARFLQEVFRPDHIALTHLPIRPEGDAPGKIDQVRQYYKDIFLMLPGMPAKIIKKREGESGQAFFGQPVPGAEPVLFAPDVLTADLGAHGRLAFSPNGREIFWSGNEKIYYATFDGKKLSPVKVAPFVSTSRHDGPVFSRDGSTVYFTSMRGLPIEKDKANGRIWGVERSASGWAQPVLLNEKIDRVTAQISLTDNGRLYFTRLVDGEITQLCARLINGRLADAEPVRFAVSNGVKLMDLYIDPQERFLIGSISRSDRESFRMADLVICFKQDDGAWGEYRLLNDKVNTDHYERFPGLSPDGRFLVFVRSSEAGSFKGARYYWVATETLGIPGFPSSNSGSGERTTAAGLFFGQAPPGLEPMKFAPEVLTSEKHPHGQLAFSPDGKRIFWSAMLQDGPEQTIFYSAFDGKTLSRPETAPFAAASGNGGPAFSTDGRRLFFSAELPPTGDSPKRATAICYVDRAGLGWTQPTPIGSTVDTLMTKGQVSVARNGNIYFSGRVLTEGTPGIYICRYSNGEYLPPEKLAGPLTTVPLLVDPWVDPDERFLLVSCPPLEGPPMLTDIGISLRQADGQWSLPIRLGGAVNTPAFERFASLSRDGKYLFFIRSFGERFVSDQAHFYWVDAKIIEELKPR